MNWEAMKMPLGGTSIVLVTVVLTWGVGGTHGAVHCDPPDDTHRGVVVATHRDNDIYADPWQLALEECLPDDSDWIMQQPEFVPAPGGPNGAGGWHGLSTATGAVGWCVSQSDCGPWRDHPAVPVFWGDPAVRAEWAYEVEENTSHAQGPKTIPGPPPTTVYDSVTPDAMGTHIPSWQTDISDADGNRCVLPSDAACRSDAMREWGTRAEFRCQRAKAADRIDINGNGGIDPNGLDANPRDGIIEYEAATPVDVDIDGDGQIDPSEIGAGLDIDGDGEADGFPDPDGIAYIPIMSVGRRCL